jgi:hypothetical protein
MCRSLAPDVPEARVCDRERLETSGWQAFAVAAEERENVR